MRRRSVRGEHHAHPCTTERTTPVRPLLSPTQRNRSRVVLTVLSGTLAATAVAGTGVATAAAARETARDVDAGARVRIGDAQRAPIDAAKAQAKALAEAQAAQAHHEALLAWAAENPVVVTVPRPVRTVVGPDVIVRASAPGSARVNGSSAPRSSKRSSTSSAKAKRPAPPPPPPVVSAAS